MARGNPTVEVRLQPGDRERWRDAAKDANMTLSDFVREAVEKRIAGPNGFTIQAPDVEITAPPRARATMANIAGCPRARFHRPGVFCKECGTVAR